MMDVVCALIQNDDGKILACKRAKGGHLAGHWEFPGGKIEPGESKRAALLREIHEELGVSVDVGDPLNAVKWTDGRIEICLSPFRCRLLLGSPRPLDHEEIRWCEPDELRLLDWAPADIPILQEWLEGC